MRWSDPLRKEQGASARRCRRRSVRIRWTGATSPVASREEVLRPFFRLAFADEDLRTSYQFAMLEHAGDAGRACPPSRPWACRRCPTSSRSGLEHPVEHGVDVLGVVRSVGDGVRIFTDGGEILARAVAGRDRPGERVVACSAWARPMMRGLATWWFSTEVPPTTMKTPFVNPIGPLGRPHLARRRGLQHRPALRTDRPAPRGRLLDRRAGDRRGDRERSRGTDPAGPDLPHRCEQPGAWSSAT